ncbi:MAG: methyltransferase domain-containing protein [Pseudomonadota bacterium]
MKLYANVITSYYQGRPNYSAAAKVLVQALEQRFANNRSIRLLDLGCGFGFHAIQLAMNKFRNITAVDNEVAMIVKFKDQVSKLQKKIQSRIKIYRDDWFNLNGEWNRENYYDCIYLLGNTIGLVGNKILFQKLFSRVTQMLKTNGLFIFDRVLFSHIDNDSCPKWSEPIFHNEENKNFQLAITKNIDMNSKEGVLILHVRWVDGSIFSDEKEIYKIYQFGTVDIDNLASIFRCRIVSLIDLDSEEKVEKGTNKCMWTLEKL